MCRAEYVLALEVITGKNLAVPSGRTPAGLYVLVTTPYGQWNTAIKATMADCSVSWNETLAIRGRPLMFPRCFIPFFSSTSKTVHIEIRALFECEPMLGRGELVGRVETRLQELLAHDGQFEVSLPAVNAQCPSLVLKAQRVKIAQLSVGVQPSRFQSEFGRDTDRARDAYTLFWKNNLLSDLDSAIQGFQVVLDRCPDGHPERGAALSNLAHAILCGFTKNIRTDIDHAISLFRSALALCPREHPDHLLYTFNLCQALQQRHLYRKDHADLHDAAVLYRSILPLCAEGSYLHRVVLETTGVLYIIEQCNALPRDPSDESVSFRRIVLELCPPQHQHRAHSVYMLAGDLCAGFEQTGNIDHIHEAIRLSRKALAIRPADHQLNFLLSNALKLRFNHHGNPHDLYESTSLEGIHRVVVHSHSGNPLSSSEQNKHHDQCNCTFCQADPGMGQLTGIPGPEQAPPPPPKTPLSNEIRSRTRNVVIFGESGAGKSSVINAIAINAIAKQQLAETSNGAAGCTDRYQRYGVNISGQDYALFDTVGLDEGTAGTVPAAEAKKRLKNLLVKLTSSGSGGISLLVYCVHSTRARRALVRNYNHFYSTICRKKVPIVVVVTGLENEPVMDSWWDTHREEFKSHGMHFKDHACVTTLCEDSDIPDDFIHRIAESREILRKLIVKNCSE
ncbi:hypothetical protein DFH29DRAFT_561839 [Suillus ampliporus]|nr:hypothetical protein DFH29DRAFT_561839 [Suillus ampliporus]